ncbi:MAG: sporulation protein YtfJ [Clostridiaceae bacterium]|nr:sporulation protein YtfJ [Clostridiaceae bacterium]
MAEHPIEGLMKTAMESIKEMVDVNTIVGDAVQAPDGTVIIPISKVSFGFASGGGEYSKKNTSKESDSNEGNDEGKYSAEKYPFAGGSGAGVSINPVAFMVVGNGKIKLLPVYVNSSLEKMLDLIPELLNKATGDAKKKIVVKKEIEPVDNTKDGNEEMKN